jgi:hypothetical protein
MMKLDAITLEFARQVIEEETGTPLDIATPATRVAAGSSEGSEAPRATSRGDDPSAGSESPRATSTGEKRLVARDDKKNPLISTFDWTADAAARVLRVPAGFMRNKTQERIETLATERGAETIDLALVEDGIELGKKMMAEMIATYEGPPSTGTRPTLNEVSPLTAREGQVPPKFA